MEEKKKTYENGYDWKCPKCGAWQNCDTTAELPEVGEELECIKCNKKSKITYGWVRYITEDEE